MAYNNGFPIGYQPIQSVQPMQPVQQAQPNVNMQQQQMYQQPAIQTQQPQSSDHGIIWVQGDAGAKSYLVAPNQSVMLMDSEQNCFYIKSADASGMPLPLRTFDYTERVQATEMPPEKERQVDMSAYITKDEYESRAANFASTIDGLSAQLSESLQKINDLSAQLESMSDYSNKKRK